ncbi:MAG: class II aldolase/adducin family protein, partial [Anaerolineae bacterium]|nr:class II aldolase/adducin family protein [Anaerolineae bacterium]
DAFKRQVVDIARLLVEKDYLKSTEGNLSLRVEGHQAFAITPSNYDYLQMSPEDICVLDWQMNVLEGTRKPSIESGLHAVVYQARADVNAVIHTHQVYASALALINAPIPALFDEQVRFLGRSVEIIPYAPSGTGFLRRRVKSRIRNGHNAYILQNHGVLVLGSSAERAVYNLELLEKCALAYLLALCTERKVTRIPLLVREIVFAKLREDEKRYARRET